MAKKYHVRTRNGNVIIVDRNLEIDGILYLPSSEEVPEKEGALRFFDDKLQVWDGAQWKESGGGISASDLGQGLTMSNNKLTLDLESKALVSPVISPSWSIYKTDGLTAYAPMPSTNSKNITVDKGCKVDLSATYSYPVPSASQAAPTSASGSFPGSMPAPGGTSSTLTAEDLVNNTGYNVSLFKPKSGLLVSGSQVVFASGNDSTGDSISAQFKVRGAVLIYSANPALTAAEIEAALNNASFRDNRNFSFTGVNPAANAYVYILFDSEFGDITSVIQNGTDQVRDAFTYLAPLAITNAAGSARTVKPLRSNAVGDFLPGTTLTTS